MIPQFPEFKKLEISDQEEVDALTNPYLPYSDYNFTSLWNYDTENLVELSIVNGNLTILFTNYLTNKPFLSFIGNRQVSSSIGALLEESSSRGIAQELSLIPEDNINNIDLSQEFHVVPDEDNYDYVLSVDEISRLQSSKYRGKRNFVNRFIKEFGEIQPTILNLQDSKVQKEIEALFFLWEQQKNKSREETKTELLAIQRLFSIASKVNLVPFGIYVDAKLAAFSMDEITTHGYAAIHFEKASSEYVGIYSYLKYSSAKNLESIGCKYISYQQDLGIEGLRAAKQQWNPQYFLKKYKISKKT